MNRYEFVIEGRTYAVDVESIDREKATVVVNGVRYEVEVAKGSRAAAPVPAPAGGPLHVRVAQPSRRRSRPTPPSLIPVVGGSGTVSAPLPGLVLDVPVSVGDPVAVGDVVVRMEAMKMENDVKATVDGVVEKVCAKTGDEVQVGQPLVEIQPS